MKRLLLRPLPDGTLVYRWAIDPDAGEESLSGEDDRSQADPTVRADSWNPIANNADRDAVVAQACSERLEGRLLVPPELCHRHPVLPFVLLRRGGRAWMRTLQQVFPGVPLSWSLEGAGERTHIRLPIPVLIRSDAPGPAWLGLLAVLFLAGLLASNALNARHRVLRVQMDNAGAQVEALERRVSLSARQEPRTATSLGSTDRVLALEGWASWMAAHLLAATVGTVGVREVRTGWLPPLELGSPRLPEALGWELHLSDATPRNIQRVASRLEALGLHVERIQEERPMDGASVPMTILTGRYPLNSNPPGESLHD
jgi:hypothetical protein